MKIKTSLILVFILASFAINAQSTPSKSSTLDTKVIQLEKSNKSAVHSDYAGMEKKILKALKGDVIPANFPKYVKGNSFEAYKVLVKEWSKNNLSLFTDEHKAKLKAKKN